MLGLSGVRHLAIPRSATGPLALSRAFTVPTHTKKAIPVFTQTPRLVPAGRHPLDVVHAQLYEKYDPDGTKRALLDKSKPTYPRAGDILRVTKTDGGSFTGMLLALNRNNLATSILLRTKISGVGVENRFNVFSPTIKKVETLRVPTLRWPKQKYYFVRGLKRHDAGDLDTYFRRNKNKR